MKPWNRFEWYPSTPKKPPPDHGIRMKRSGTTWWGQRWIEALEVVLRGSAGRLSRGRTYARAGRTHDLVVRGGAVTAAVTGSRPTPYTVTIRLGELPPDVWDKAVRGMAEKAHFSAELLGGRMPTDIDDVFRDAGASLFPAARADLATACSCPDWGDPCKHVAATHYVLGEALDRDPFLLFELRGRTKQQVLDALRSVRAGAGPAKRARTKGRASGVEPAGADVPKVRLEKLRAADYDRPRAPPPALHLSFDEPVAPGAVLRQLGAPAAWSREGSPADALAPLIRAAAERARKIALVEPAADEPRGAPSEPEAARGPAAPEARKKQPKRAAKRRG